ncbi:MAG: META domain-containing protein [Anaerolineales bacterium]
MKRMKSSKDGRIVKAVLIIMLTAVLLLAACSSEEAATEAVDTGGEQPQQPPADQGAALANTPWALVGYGDAANPTVVEDGTLVTVFFGPDGTVSGSGGCNNYNSTYQMEGNNLTIASPIASTMMACEKGMEQEQTYLAALQTAQSYQVTESGSLNIKYDTGAGIEQVLIYIPERAPLEGTTWTLVSMGPADSPQPPVAGATFTAQFLRDPNFPTGAVSGTTGCNEYRAAYYATENEIKINLPSASANTDCPAGLPEQEQAFYQGLNQARSYRIISQNMQVFYGDQVMNFSLGGAPAPAVTETPAEGGDLAGLNGTKWWLNSIDTAPLIPDTEITAEFTINEDGITGVINGFSGCNTYSGEITGVFTVANTISSQTACEQALMDQETTYLAALGTSTGITYDPTQMLINTQFGVLAFSSAPAVSQPIETGEPTAEQPLPTGEPTSEGPVETVQVPVAIIAITPDPSTVGGSTSFDGSSSYSGTDIVSYTWDFGDGTGAEGAFVEHNYTAGGIYVVTLTITDAFGQISAGQYPLTVQ